MKTIKVTGVLCVLFFAFLLACNGEVDTVVEPQDAFLVDPDATQETVNLFRNLSRVSQDHVLFGHQDDLAYGVHWWDEPGRSDVYEVAGSYPAVYGWELGDLELDAEANLDDVNFESMRQWIQEGYERGGIITIGWHMNNPVTGGSAWDTEPNTVAQILPGGELHDKFLGWLDKLVAFNEGLVSTDENGDTHQIPVIFRPYHEHNGSWFWWGRDLTTEEEYIELWRFTVEYLRDEKNVRNFLYAISPDRSRTNIDTFKEDLLYGYPGDEYVDIIGLDNYWDLGHPSNDAPADEQLDHFIRSLQYTVEVAEERNKIPALTEGGFEGIPNPNWWTEVFLAGFDANETTRRIAYALVWRNAHTDRNPDHFYAPHPGHPSADNFVKFRNLELILFEADLPDMYQ